MTPVSQQRWKSRPERGLSHIVRSLCEAASRNKPRQLRDGLKGSASGWYPRGLLEQVGPIGEIRAKSAPP